MSGMRADAYQTPNLRNPGTVRFDVEAQYPGMGRGVIMHTDDGIPLTYRAGLYLTEELTLGNAQRALALTTGAMQLAHNSDMSNPLNRLAAASVATASAALLCASCIAPWAANELTQYRFSRVAAYDAVRLGIMGINMANAITLLQNTDELAMNGHHKNVAIASLSLAGLMALLTLMRHTIKRC